MHLFTMARFNIRMGYYMLAWMSYSLSWCWFNTHFKWRYTLFILKIFVSQKPASTLLFCGEFSVSITTIFHIFLRLQLFKFAIIIKSLTINRSIKRCWMCRCCWRLKGTHTIFGMTRTQKKFIVCDDSLLSTSQHCNINFMVANKVSTQLLKTRSRKANIQRRTIARKRSHWNH